jgi:hypothetical protein
MNLLANLSVTYRESLVSNNGAGILEAGTHGNRPVSPFAEMMNILQQMKQSDPTLHQRVMQETVTNLGTAAQTAAAALDIRQIAGRRRGAWLHSIVSRWGRLMSHSGAVSRLRGTVS